MKSVSAVLFFALSLSANASIVDLGSASEYIIATGGYGSVNIGSSSNIGGNVGSDYYVSVGSNTIINGELCSPAQGVGAGAQVKGCSTPRSFYQDILNANNSLSALSPMDPTFSIRSSMELSPGVYAIDNLSLSHNEVLTLSGDPDDVFVINVSGDAVLSMNSKIELNGVSSSNVFFNFLDSSEHNIFSFSGEQIAGTFISNNRSFIMGTGQDIYDARFFTNGSVIAHFGELNYSPLDGTPPDDLSNVPVMGINVLFILIFAIAVFATREKKASIPSQA